MKKEYFEEIRDALKAISGFAETQAERLALINTNTVRAAAFNNRRTFFNSQTYRARPEDAEVFNLEDNPGKTVQGESLNPRQLLLRHQNGQSIHAKVYKPLEDDDVDLTGMDQQDKVMYLREVMQAGVAARERIQARVGKRDKERAEQEKINSEFTDKLNYIVNHFSVDDMNAFMKGGSSQEEGQ